MDGGPWYKRLHAGGSSGGDGAKWDLKPIYRSLTAAYGWTYSQIDEHTLAEVNDLFLGWDEYPPTNIVVKAIAMGFGAQFVAKGTTETDANGNELYIPPSANYAMQDSAAQAITSKAAGRLPMLQSRDPGLPTAPPVFDVDELRKRNVSVLVRRAKKGAT